MMMQSWLLFRIPEVSEDGVFIQNWWEKETTKATSHSLTHALTSRWRASFSNFSAALWASVAAFLAFAPTVSAAMASSATSFLLLDFFASSYDLQVRMSQS